MRQELHRVGNRLFVGIVNAALIGWILLSVGIYIWRYFT